jgi:hypothetical protein
LIKFKITLEGKITHLEEEIKAEVAASITLKKQSAAIQSSSNDLIAAKKKLDARITDLEGKNIYKCISEHKHFF